jgi:hypothetical protein
MLGVVIWYVHGSKGGHIIIIGTRYCGHVIIQCVAVILGGCARVYWGGMYYWLE